MTDQMKNDGHVWDNKKPTAQMLGRWQPWHAGHQKLFEEILKKLLQLIEKKRILFPLPLFFATLSAKFFQLLPNPLITQDQLKLLKYDNVLSGKYKSNSDIGVPSLRYFDEEVKKYCYMWRDGGQFSTEKYSSDNIDIKTN